MRIAILSYEYPPETGFGDIGTYSYYQSRALARLGHDVHVFAGSTENGIWHCERDGLKITRIKRFGWRIKAGFGAFEAFRHEHDKKPFDFVEAPECGADSMMTSTLLQVPTAVRFHSPTRLSMNLCDTPRIDRELCAFVEQLAINQAEVLTACSGFLADEVATRMHESKPIHVIPNGIDIELFDRDAGIDVYEEFGLPKGKQLIFCANRMAEQKDIHIVEAMVEQTLAEHEDLAFVFVGRDPFGHMEQRILPWVRDKQLQSRFFHLGQQQPSSVRALLEASSIFVITGLRENCPYSCIEAMTAGRAIVSSDGGGMPELIEDRRTGLLAKSGDPQAFVEVLREMIEDDRLRDRCGIAARAEVEKRLADVAIAERGIDVYRDHLDGNSMPTEEVADLRRRIAKLTAELDESRRREAELKFSREFRWGKHLLNAAKLGNRDRMM